MNYQAVVHTQQSALTSVPARVLQRACACGQHTMGGEECETCRKERGGGIQRATLSGLTTPFTIVAHSVGEDFSHILVSQPDDSAEREAEHMANQVAQALNGRGLGQPTAGQLTPLAPLVQRQAEMEPPIEEAAPAAEPEPEAEPEAPTTTTGLLVEDDADKVGPEQMRKSDFLAQLRTEVCAAANAELAAVGRSTEGCPYLDYWFDYYSARDSQHIERALQRYAPEAAGVTSARDYIPIVVERVRQAVTVWATTGQVTGVPEGVPTTVPGAETTSGSQASSEPGAVQFKGREGGPRVANLQTIRARLRAGTPLDSTTRGRMESAFGYDFSRVRVHTDAAAAGLSSELNAKAFTIGGDVAFGAGEYQPGTLLGDALIAHELAHVVQQGGAQPDIAPLETNGNSSNTMEDDADRSVIGVMAALWGGTKGAFKEIAKNAIPRLRSGLSLRRCPCDKAEETIRYRFIAKSGFDVCVYCACTKAEGGADDRLIGPGPEGKCPPGREVRWKCRKELSNTSLSTEPCPQSFPGAECR